MKRNFFILYIFSILISDSFNMDLLSHLSYEITASDITGFEQDGREFAVMGLANAATFVDITNPYNPFEVGRIEGGNSTWRDIKYWDRHVYIGTEADDGIKVVDVTDLDNPTLVYTITDVDNSHNVHVYEGYLYIVGADTHDIWIYDLSDPSSPEFVGAWDGEYIHDLEVYNDKAYAMGIYSSTAYIIDLSDKSNPSTIVSWQYPGMAHDCAVTLDERYLVTADEMEGGYIRMWDIEDYNNITEVGYFIGNPAHSVHNVYIKDGLLYASWYADGTRVFDISQPDNIVEIARYDTSEIEGLYVGNWGVYVYLPSGNIISSDMETGLYVTKLGGISILHQSIEDVDIYNDGPYVPFQAEVTTFNGNIDEVVLHYSFDRENWSQTNMLNSNNSSLYEAVMTFDEADVLVYYYITASNDEEDSSILPYNGSENPFMFIYGELDNFIYDSFNTDTGWSNGLNDDATGGIWERAIPNGTTYQGEQVQPEEDNSSTDDYCYVTGNGVGDSVGFDDIDGGVTSIISPTYDLSEYTSVLLTYFRWFTNNLGDNPSSDRFYVQASNDNGVTWIDLENTNLSNNSWERKRFLLSDYIDLSSEVVFKIQAEDIFYNQDFGSGGSLVEAALDDFKIDIISYNGFIGDINTDSVINVLDIVLLINFILDLQIPEGNQFLLSDINGDSVLNVLDVVLLVNLILDN